MQNILSLKTSTTNGFEHNSQIILSEVVIEYLFNIQHVPIISIQNGHLFLGFGAMKEREV